MREGIFHSFGYYIASGFYAELGSNSGVFVFTNRGDGGRIERAVLGRRWRVPESRVQNANDVVEESGTYDIIGEAVDRIQIMTEHNNPGSPETEYDHRFDGIGEFVAERDPKRIAVNYMEKLGHHVGAPTNDGISYTDYLLLTKELSNKYVERLVSSEYMMHDYISRPVKSALVMYKKIRKWVDENLEKEFSQIEPGVTKLRDVGATVLEKSPGDGFNTKRGITRRGDRVFQRGDFFRIGHGTEAEYDLRGIEHTWQFGNIFELKTEYGYVLRNGEVGPPSQLKKFWAGAMNIRQVLEDNIKVGRTGSETWKILKPKLAEAGFIVNDRQQHYKDLDS